MTSNTSKAETFLWEGPESGIDAVIRRRSPLPKGWWFRSVVHPDRIGWVRLFKVRPERSVPTKITDAHWIASGGMGDPTP